MDIGRVTAVYPNKMTIDLVGLDNDEYSNVRFLSLYAKPNSNNQGVFMIPEIGSYGVIFKIKNQYFCFGFLVENDGIEDMYPGEYLFKTEAGNKIWGHSDGRITIMTTNMNKIELFPESGNAKDSYGYDNLLRAVIENYEITTGGSFHKRSVNKKENTTNLYEEFRNKPIMKDNPTLIRQNKGSQGPTGNDEYIFTHQIIETSREGQDEEVTREYKVKPDGSSEFKKYEQEKEVYKEKINVDGSKEVDIKGKFTHKMYDGDDVAQEYEVNPDGSSKLSVGGGKLTIDISAEGKLEINTEEEVEISTNKNTTINTGENTIINADGDVDVEANGDVNISGSKIDLGDGSEPIPLGNALMSLFNTHIHTGNMGGPTSTPLELMNNNVHLSNLSNTD